MGKTNRFDPKSILDHQQEREDLVKSLPKSKKVKKKFLMPHELSSKEIHGHFSKGNHIWPIQVNPKKKGHQKI